MVDHAVLLDVFSAYSDALLSPYRVGDVLYQLADQVVDVLGVDGAGVSVARGDGRLKFVAATDAQVATVEAQQEAGAEGPCHDAYHAGEPVSVADLADEPRWPAYREVALEQGCRAVAGVPMPAHERRIGALNLYCHDPRSWSEEELTVGQLLANMASGYILNHTALSKSRDVVGQLQNALDSRVAIEQAKGIVAAQRDCSTGEAFELLRTHARSHNERLHDLCERVVASTERSDATA